MSLSDKLELMKQSDPARPSFSCSTAAALSSVLNVCLPTSPKCSAGFIWREGDSHWGHMSQEVHGALEIQWGPEKGSQEGLDTEN